MQNTDLRLTASLIIPSSKGYWYVKNKKDGLWGLPGGKITISLKEYEPANKTGMRETEEELGVKTELKHLIGIYQFISSRGHPVCNIVYSAEIKKGTPHIVKPDEILEIGQFKINEIERMYKTKQLRGGKSNICPIQDYRRGTRISLDRLVFLR